ncbi:Clp protease N-terminal domain-containing protein [Amycolatopsis sp. NPDC051373]|uniref:Clp protease N-terminal domain-containing protein n=1 Tax=Amycolatopsis sp. NPDC051373 TaxID=3155801 RepID=UPI00344CEFD3
MRSQRFDDDVRALVRTAQERARTLSHPGVGSEHLLYAVAYSPTPVGVVAREHGLTPGGVAAQTDRLLARPHSVFDGVDAEALATIGIDLQAVREAVEASFGLGPAPSSRSRRPRVRRLPGHLAVTGRARSCLDAAVHEADRSGAVQVAAHHFGAAVVAADTGLVPPILAALGVSAPTLRTAILDCACG